MLRWRWCLHVLIEQFKPNCSVLMDADCADSLCWEHCPGRNYAMLAGLFSLCTPCLKWRSLRQDSPWFHLQRGIYIKCCFCGGTFKCPVWWVRAAVLLPGVCRHCAQHCSLTSGSLEQPGTKHKSLYCTPCTVLVTQGISASSVAKLDSKRD